MTYTETNQLQVLSGYDVIVIGGGVAGVSAALATAHMGKRVLLVEKSTMPGGLATAGLVAHYLPICDGKGKDGEDIWGCVMHRIVFELNDITMGC